MLFLLELVGCVAAEIANLYPSLFHAPMDLLHQILPALFGERRDIEAHDRAVHVRDEPDVALDDRLLDCAQDARFGPRLRTSTLAA